MHNAKPQKRQDSGRKTMEGFKGTLVTLAATLLLWEAGAQEATAVKQEPAAQTTTVKQDPMTREQAAEKADPDSMEAITNRMLATRKAMTEVEKRIAERTKLIQDMFDNYNRAERNLTGFNGLGRVEQMELKAELYGGERMSRKKLGEEFSVLSAAMTEWTQLKGKMEEDRRLLALRRQILDLKKAKDASGADGKSSGGSIKVTDIEYYQVKKEADLRTISAYPEVYGTPELWDYLYKANKDKLVDPDKPVPAGTTLIVPQDVKKLPDFNGI
jgi:hypothetical protein